MLQAKIYLCLHIQRKRHQADKHSSVHCSKTLLHTTNTNAI